MPPLIVLCTFVSRTILTRFLAASNWSTHYQYEFQPSRNVKICSREAQITAIRETQASKIFELVGT